MLFTLISILLISSSILVLFARNPVHSVFFLVLSFLLIALLTFTMNVNFLGIIFIIIYVGAIAVLFLFVVMMLNIRYIELKNNYLRYIPIVFVLVIFCLSLICLEFLNLNELSEMSIKPNTGFLGEPLTQGNWIQNISEEESIKLLGFLLYNYYSLVFIVSSLILLVAMVGTIVLTLNQNFKLRRQDISHQVMRRISSSIKVKN